MFTDTLAPEDLATLVNELYEVRAIWYDVGVQLRMMTSDLDAIQTQYQNNPKTCLRQMLSDWLTNEVPSPPTWQRVVDALSTPAIGKQSAAERLKQVYCEPNPTLAPGILYSNHGRNFIVTQFVYFLDSSKKPYETLKTKIVNLERAFAKLRMGIYRLIRDEPVDIFIAGLLAMDVNRQEHHIPILTEITQEK